MLCKCTSLCPPFHYSGAAWVANLFNNHAIWSFFKKMQTPRINPDTFYMENMCSATELYGVSLNAPSLAQSWHSTHLPGSVSQVERFMSNAEQLPHQTLHRYRKRIQAIATARHHGSAPINHDWQMHWSGISENGLGAPKRPRSGIQRGGTGVNTFNCNPKNLLAMTNPSIIDVK